jgi:S-adenosylmethionine:tRNA ribosyltransferase-isomerase
VTPVTLDFRLPDELSADGPPEERGVARDRVRLLVASANGIQHTRFSELTRFLDRGDVLVVNTSATLPAAVGGHRRDGRPVAVHFSTHLSTGPDHEVWPNHEIWVVELRPARRATGPVTDAVAGELVTLPGGAPMRLLAGYPGDGSSAGRLWVARIATEHGVLQLLQAFGRPITYSYVTGDWPLSAYQTVFASEPGSAEMPSAGRPFTRRMVSSLVRRGVVLAPITLHTGVSSAEKGEGPLPEPYVVDGPTAAAVNTARREGRRVIAVGTTATRALETAAGSDGEVRPSRGWTDLVLGPETPARVVNGLVTGWHAPGASHLRLLEAVAGRRLVALAYDEALRERYLWHEFGDSCLLLADPAPR